MSVVHACCIIMIFLIPCHIITAYCEHGTKSENGFQPCNPCEEGFYQLKYGSKSCEKCLPNDHSKTAQCPQNNYTEYVTPSIQPTNDTAEQAGEVTPSTGVFITAVITVGFICESINQNIVLNYCIIICTF